MTINTDIRKKLIDNNRAIFICETSDLVSLWHSTKANKLRRGIDNYKPKNTSASGHFSEMARSHTSSTIAPYPPQGAPPHPLALTHTPCHSHNPTHWGAVSSTPSLQETVRFAKGFIAPYVSPILDLNTLRFLISDLGIKCSIRPKIIKGRQYIALSGYPGLRKFFTGTIYSVKNPKIIQMAIGSLGIKNMIKSGGRLTIYLTVPLTILEYFLRDQSTLYDLAGHLASDLIKVGISTIITAIFGLSLGGAKVFACLPIATVIIVGVGVGIRDSD